jgi:hypothetical protein
VLASLDAIRATDPTAQHLVGLLRTAMNLSLQSNYGWKSWIESQSDVGCPVPTADKTQADAISDQATSAKQAFVAAFNPVAAQYGLGPWSDKDF